MDDSLIILRIDSLLEHIDLVLKDTKNLTVDELAKTDLLLRATCFSLAQIGEIMNQLEKTLSQTYKELPWVGARRMRNVIVHDYGGTIVVLGAIENMSNSSYFSVASSMTKYNLSLHSSGSHTLTVSGTSYSFTNSYSYAKTICYSDSAVSGS